MWNANTEPIVKTVEAFSGEAYGRVWNSQGHVIGPQVRVQMDAKEAEEFMMSHKARYFTKEDGLREGWWYACNAGSRYTSAMGAFFGYAVVVPAPPPERHDERR